MKSGDFRSDKLQPRSTYFRKVQISTGIWSLPSRSAFSLPSERTSSGCAPSYLLNMTARKRLSMFLLSAGKVRRYPAMYGFIAYFEMVFISISTRAHFRFFHLDYTRRNMGSQAVSRLIDFELLETSSCCSAGIRAFFPKKSSESFQCGLPGWI